jgi:hypothetical protein
MAFAVIGPHRYAPVDELPVAEVLPGLYRAVLDAVASLEARQRRSEAAAIRSEATRVYSRAWTPDAARRLRVLLTRAHRIGQGRAHTRYVTVTDTTVGPSADMKRRPA